MTMETVSIVMLCVAIAVYIIRCVVKFKGVDIVAGVISACATMLIIQDTTIPSDQLILYVLPTISILLLTFLHIAFGNSKGVY